tara:strand:- start:3630 stop:4076 length:447 start_codon:yes stop_codon:yes gene_type:complete
MLLRIKKLSLEAKTPEKNNNSDSGYDFFVLKDKGWGGPDECTLRPGERKLFSTGIALELPVGYGMLLKDRSGLSVKEGLHVLAGVIDNGYRGEVKICLANISNINVRISDGQKIAQGVLHQVPICEVKEITDLSETERGGKGFGSSGS